MIIINQQKLFQLTFSALCFLVKTTQKVVNGKTVSRDFLVFMVMKSHEKVRKFGYVI